MPAWMKNKMNKLRWIETEKNRDLNWTWTQDKSSIPISAASCISWNAMPGMPTVMWGFDCVWAVHWMYAFVHRSAGRTVCIGWHLRSSFSEASVWFQWLSLLTEGRNTNREPMYTDADKMSWFDIPLLSFSFILHINLIILAFFPAVYCSYSVVGTVSQAILVLLLFHSPFGQYLMGIFLSTELVHVILARYH